MKLMLTACIFLAGVYLGFHAEPDSGLIQVVDILETLVGNLSTVR